jgi:hypothetical protein
MNEDTPEQKELRNVKGALAGAVKTLRAICDRSKIDMDKPLNGLPPQFTMRTIFDEWERLSKS